MRVPSWFKRKEPLRLSEASLARIRRVERERELQRQADKRHAEQDLIIKP